jgi:hypothetical protein
MGSDTERMVESQGLVTVETGTLAVLTKAEIDTQISTAKQYPRSIKRFRDEALEMVTLTERIAEECIYAPPRDGKTIEGPSARFAEVVASAWGNCRAGARVVGEETDFVIAQGVFHDLERNVAITYEVKRRIVDKYNRRYKPDMIGVTANAACSIALRNAILKGIPKAFWTDMYEAARQTAIGDAKTLANKRADMLGYFQKLGATPEMICATLEVPGVEDIGLEELAKLKGIATAIKEGDTTVEQVFAVPAREEKTGKGAEGLKEKLKGAAPQEAGGSSPLSASAASQEAQPPLRDPGADEGEDEVYGYRGKAPENTTELIQTLGKLTTDVEVEGLFEAAAGLLEKCSPQIRKAMEKAKADRLAVIAKGGAA